jgi:hypothetical protein
MAVGARSAVRVRWVAFISLCMPASVAVTLFYSHASAMLYVKLVVTYSVSGSHQPNCTGPIPSCGNVI